MKNLRGFTLIELLVVVTIISILVAASIILINPQGIRKKARDSQRKADLHKIQVALELYFADNKKYPPFEGLYSLVPNYISALPTNPNSKETYVGGCPYRSDTTYGYLPWNSNTNYSLVSFMEIAGSGNVSCSSVIGSYCGNYTTPSGYSDMCYALYNP